MSDHTFLFVDDEPISQAQIIDYLRVAGQLDEFIETVLTQHAIAQERQIHPELSPTEAPTEQLLKDFRQTQNLSDPAVFEAWLQQNDITLEALSDTLQQDWSMQQLVQQVSQPHLYEHFIRRKLALDRVVLSCIVVQEETLASELYDQIKEDNSFEQLAQRYSLAESAQTGGKLPPMARNALSDELRSEIEIAQVGGLIGPLAVEGRWYLFRLEKILPAALEGEVQAQLQRELFQQWLDQQVAAMTVKMEVTQWLYL